MQTAAAPTPTEAAEAAVLMVAATAAVSVMRTAQRGPLRRGAFFEADLRLLLGRRPR